MRYHFHKSFENGVLILPEPTFRGKGFPKGTYMYGPAITNPWWIWLIDEHSPRGDWYARMPNDVPKAIRLKLLLLI